MPIFKDNRRKVTVNPASFIFLQFLDPKMYSLRCLWKLEPGASCCSTTGSTWWVNGDPEQGKCNGNET